MTEAAADKHDQLRGSCCSLFLEDESQEMLFEMVSTLMRGCVNVKCKTSFIQQVNFLYLV